MDGQRDDGWMDSKNGGTNWDPQQPYNTHHLNAKAAHLSQDFLYTASHALLWLHPFYHVSPAHNFLRDACDLPHFCSHKLPAHCPFKLSFIPSDICPVPYGSDSILFVVQGTQGNSAQTLGGRQ